MSDLSWHLSVSRREFVKAHKLAEPQEIKTLMDECLAVHGVVPNDQV